MPMLYVPINSEHAMGFDRVLAQYSFVYDLAYRRTGNWSLAEDLTQETMMKAWRYFDKKYDEFEQIKDIRAWLASIFFNTRNDYYRREKLPASIRDEADANEKPDLVERLSIGHDLGELENALDVGLTLDVVLKVVDKMPQIYGHALMLAAIGLSKKEVAKWMGCAEHTAGVRVHRARELLKGYIQQKFD